MDFVKVATAPLPAPPELDVGKAFSKVIHLWREHCHTVNRRLLCALRVDERNFKIDHTLPVYSVFSNSVETRSCSLDKHVVEFRPSVLDDKRHPHVSFPYRLALEEVPNHQWNLTLFVSNDATHYIWLQKVAFSRLLKWFVEVGKVRITTVSHRLINMEDYFQYYSEIKNKWGEQIVATWSERTNPQKFVYEDCAIAAYLIINGYGIDLRQRKIWTKFVGTDLREKTLHPDEDLLSDSDFIIGNHTDELTPWIPIMAARLNCFVSKIPLLSDLEAIFSCCRVVHSIFTVVFKKRVGWLPLNIFKRLESQIFSRLGYRVEQDRLKIPSTKRHCFLCTVPDGGLVENVENIISDMLTHTTLSDFVPREKVDRIRNFLKLPRDFEQSLTAKIFKHLLELSSDRTTICWRKGGSCSLKEIAGVLNEEEKVQLRDSDGGLQTFLKNQHQIFKVVKGTVSIRNWAEEGNRKVEGKVRTKDCWFYKYHPNGCPLSNDCSYKH